MISNVGNRNELIKAKANELGFLICRIAKAEYMEAEAKQLDIWLNQHYHGGMSYMANHFDMRVDPTKLVPGSKSVITLAYNYYTTEKQSDPSAPKISMYAYGKDYHKVVRKQMKTLLEWMKSTFGEIDGRVFVDSAPVLERDWAKRSGLGWIGKNTMVIHPRKGSYFFLGEIISDLEIKPDSPIDDYCGTCTRCIDACPTDAISPSGYLMDGSKCISYLTIEYKEKLPEAYKNRMEGWAYGCDICQQVCPWNRFSTQHNEDAFNPHQDLLTMSREEWLDLSEPMYNQIFEGSAVKRAKYEGLKRNIEFLNDNSKPIH
jgi:epoxyqueuosine reductase